MLYWHCLGIILFASPLRTNNLGQQKRWASSPLLLEKAGLQDLVFSVGLLLTKVGPAVFQKSWAKNATTKKNLLIKTTLRAFLS